MIAPATVEVATRDSTASPNGLFAVRYRKDLINDPQKRSEDAEGIFAVRYSKDLISDPEKRSQLTRRDIIDSTAPSTQLENREVAEPAGIFAVSYRKDVIASQE